MVPVVVVVLLVIVAVWWRQYDSAHHAATTTSAGAASSSGQARHADVSIQNQAFPPDRSMPAWFVRGKTKPRRIAGRVTRDGKPAPGATVTLQSILTEAGYGSVVEACGC